MEPAKPQAQSRTGPHAHSRTGQSDASDSARAAGALQIPSLTLPKGGGAIHGIGEKFAVNPATGTGSLSVPVATSPGRSGFGPQLALSYDSGAGNGPFGMGWSLFAPSIARKTDKGLPRYRDADESDVFIISGAEDLVPAFKRSADGTWARDPDGNPLPDEEVRIGYTIKRYRPRIEGLFARIERWTRISDRDTHWRTISKENVLTVYGATLESRVADPADVSRVFSWLICESYDDKGNAVLYEYVAENAEGVDASQTNERNRARSANRYLKYVRYGNRRPFLIDPAQPSFRQSHVPTPDFSSAGWMFEVVLDYGEGHYREALPDADGRVFATPLLKPPSGGQWPARLDPFSVYRSCFEVRTYRLCRRVLMFHHFPDELGTDDCLVRATEFTYHEKPNGSFITGILQAGFKRVALPTPRYLKRSLPPLEFGYSPSPLDDLTYDELPLHEVETESLRNLPAGVDGDGYRWVDLHGEGISGVLSEQADTWFYKRNLGEGHLGPARPVSPRPSFAALRRGRQQLLDLEGDGHLELVEFGAPTPGYFSRTEDGGWERFRTFASLPNIDWQDPNLRFVDLTGDGHADILIADDQVFSTWHESYAEDGFAAATHVHFAADREDGPRLVFADGTQSIYLADMSGDGLSDLVRIDKSEVCYWSNIGYGRFGAKVTMDNVPWFDDTESFDQRRLHLTDTDGSGPTDIIYLGRDGVRVYLNEHGNSLSDARLLSRVPRTDNLSSVSVADLLGRGTACLVWSSPLPGDARNPLRYLDLMAGVKPHLLVTVRNNLGAETRIEYASSTTFYLADNARGTPWVTHLPFPVHVVTRVETNDLVTGNTFSTIHSYHHGYFDGVEREFRGFGRVDLKDTENFGGFAVPPTLTKTWFHTGAYFDGTRISRHLAGEYYGEGDPGQPGSELSPAQLEAMRLDDTVLPEGLSVEESREATRSLKGAILRQEIYALDDTAASSRPYSVSERNYTIRPVQPRGANRHAIFFTHARETIDFHYERKLFPVLNGQVVDDPAAPQNSGATRLADPRVTHNVALDVDDYGNVLKSVAIAYGRRFDDANPVLSDADRKKQKQLFVTLSDASVTNGVVAVDAYRAPLPADARTYELVKLRRSSALPSITNLLRFNELLALVAQAGDGAHDLPYEDINATRAVGAGCYRRVIEEVRIRYRSNNLSQLLAGRTLQALAVPGETYQLAFTPGLLSAAYQRAVAGQAAENLLPNPAGVFLADGNPASDRGGYVDLDGDGRWWMPSGRTFFHPADTATAADELADAAAHFFVARRFRDPFGRSTIVDYASDLLPCRTRDAAGNTVEALHDYRVLQPTLLTDPNGNRSVLVFDALGLAVATAVRGKSSEAIGDSLDDFTDLDGDPSLADLQAFVARPADRKASLLKSSTTRFVYDLDRYHRCNQPSFAATLMRETHVSDLLAPEVSNVQVSFAYSDGFGRELQTKIQAEPGLAPARAANGTAPGGDVVPGALTLTNGVPVLSAANPRWASQGRAVYNNKGKPFKQYEPFFSTTHLYEPESEVTDTGVTPILFYDPVERVVATLHPNHTYDKLVFDPWRQDTWDVNDTVTLSDPTTDPDIGGFFQRLPDADYLPTWFDQRRNGQKGPDEQSAATKAAAHAGTPATTYLDSLGRAVVTIVDNGKDASGLPEKFVTRVTLDVEGNRREVKDAANRVVMRYDYDMRGNVIHESSMEAGGRWMLHDVGGNAIRGWDSRAHTVRTEYDEVRRPLRSFVIGADSGDAAREIQSGEIVYGESAAAGLTAPQVLQANLRGKSYRQRDTAGVVTSEAYDFKGNLLRSTRQLVRDYTATPDWSRSPSPVLEAEVFASSTRYDALNRPVQTVPPHNAAGAISVVRPGYSEANLLERVDVWLERPAEPMTLLDPASASLRAVVNIDYDAKGQRTRIEYGNGVVTEYTYDEQTLRLTHLKTGRTAPAPQGLIGRLLGPPAPLVTATLQDLFYTYDPTGHVTHIRDDAQQTIHFAGSVVQPECDYVYDPVYRLVNATGREHRGQISQPQTSCDDEFRVNLPHPGDGPAMRNYTDQYVYDGVGNLERVIHQTANGNWTRTYAHNEASLIEGSRKSNRLSSTTVGPTTEPYTYDAHGNMTSMPHLSLMRWDFQDQLSATSRQVVSGAPPSGVVPETTWYVYDSGGQRVRKVSARQNGTRRTERLYLGGFELFREFTATGTAVALERETLHLVDGHKRIVLVETRTAGSDGSAAQLVRYQLGNHLGSASLELNAEGAVISYEEYTPYGSTSYQAVDRALRALAKRYRFTGKERDEETGFTYHRARYYAAWLCRWTASDPIGVDAGLNTYAYVRDNPINLIDSEGTADTPPTPRHDVGFFTKVGLALEVASLVITHKTPAQLVEPITTLYGPTGMVAKGGEKLADKIQGVDYPDDHYVTKEESAKQLRAIIDVGGALAPELPKIKVALPGPPGPPLVAAGVGAVGVTATAVAVGPGLPQGAGLLASAASKGGIGSAPAETKKATRQFSGDRVPYQVSGSEKAFQSLKGTGVYVLKDAKGHVLYVGEGNVLDRLRAHISDPKKTPWFGEIARVEVHGSELLKKESLALEEDLIQQLEPLHNEQLKPFEDAFPGQLRGADLPRSQQVQAFDVKLGASGR
jgi:RHS repeat-associated protein